MSAQGPRRAGFVPRRLAYSESRRAIVMSSLAARGSFNRVRGRVHSCSSRATVVRGTVSSRLRPRAGLPRVPCRPLAFVDANTEMRRTSTSVSPPRAWMPTLSVRLLVRCDVSVQARARRCRGEYRNYFAPTRASALNALSPALWRAAKLSLARAAARQRVVCGKAPVLTYLCKFTLLAALPSLQTSTRPSSSTRTMVSVPAPRCMRRSSCSGAGRPRAERSSQAIVQA